MAIKRITELRNLEVDSSNLENFKNSYMEVSYETNLNSHSYESRGMLVEDFIDAVGQASDSGEQPLTGNFIYNDGDAGAANAYNCELNFGGHVHLKSDGVKIQAESGSDIAEFLPGAAGINMKSHRIGGMAAPVSDGDAVNLAYLKSYVAQAIADINTGDSPAINPEQVLSSVYPIGSIYLTTNDTCPLTAVLPGSTWQKVGDGKYLATSANDGHTHITPDDMTFDIKKSTAIIRDKGHAEASFVQSVKLRSDTNIEILPPSFKVVVWQRTS